MASVAEGISDIGAASSASTITGAQTANPNNPAYQNLYYTMIGGRGVVFIQDASMIADPSNVVSTADLNAAYLDASGNGGKTTAVTTNLTHIGTTMEQREAGSGTMSTAFGWIGGSAKGNTSTGYNNLPTQNGNAAMLAAVQAGTSTAPVIGFVDAGYAFTGYSDQQRHRIGYLGYGRCRWNSDSIICPDPRQHQGSTQGLGQGQLSGNQLPPEAHRRSLLDHRGNCTHRSRSTVLSQPQVPAQPDSVVTNLINFAKSPAEATAFNNAGMYSLYDFAPTSELNNSNHIFFFFTMNEKTDLHKVLFLSCSVVTALSVIVIIGYILYAASPVLETRGARFYLRIDVGLSISPVWYLVVYRRNSDGNRRHYRTSAVPLGLATALFLSEWAPPWLDQSAEYAHRTAGGNTVCRIRYLRLFCPAELFH